MGVVARRQRSDTAEDAVASEQPAKKRPNLEEELEDIFISGDEGKGQRNPPRGSSPGDDKLDTKSHSFSAFKQLLLLVSALALKNAGMVSVVRSVALETFILLRSMCYSVEGAEPILLSEVTKKLPRTSSQPTEMRHQYSVRLAGHRTSTFG